MMSGRRPEPAAHAVGTSYDAPMGTPPETFVGEGGENADRIEFPDVVAAFEALGFVRVGRIGQADRGRLWREAAAYPKAVRTDYVTHRAVPAVVLAAADQSAFVVVSWWWDMPDVRIRTAMTDGSVLETLRTWERAPVPMRGYGRLYRDGDLHQEQLMTNAPEGGRKVSLAEGSPADLWSQHRERISQLRRDTGAQPVVHADVSAAAALSNRLAQHQVACHRAQVSRGRWILAAILGFGAAFIVAALVLPPTVDLLLLILVIIALVAVIGLRGRIRAGSFRRRYDAGRRPPLAPGS